MCRGCRSVEGSDTVDTVDNIRASRMSTLVDTSVGSVEGVSRGCRLTPVSTVSKVSRECRVCVENVSRVSSQGSTLTRVAVLAGRGVSILTVVQPTRKALWSTVVALHFQNEPPPELLTTRAAVLGPRRRADDLVLFNFSIDPDRGVHVQ